MTATVEELQALGLLEGRLPHLTERGQDFLRLLADIQGGEPSDASEAAADLVLSTSALIR